MAARSTSRQTCLDKFEAWVSTTTMTRELRIAATSAEGQVIPGGTSLGAIQQRTPAASSAWQVASAAVLSEPERLMKTSCAISSPMGHECAALHYRIASIASSSRCADSS